MYSQWLKTHTRYTHTCHAYLHILHISTRKVKLFASFKIGKQTNKKTVIPEEMERSPEDVWPW